MRFLSSCLAAVLAVAPAAAQDDHPPSPIHTLRPPYEWGASEAWRTPATWTVLVATVVALAASLALTSFLLGPSSSDRKLVEPPVAEGEWAIEWGRSVQPPAAEQARQVRALRRVAGGAAALVSALCLLIVAGLWRQRLTLRRAEHDVHWAVGARVLQSAARVAGEGRAWAAVALVVSAGATLLALGLVERTFPGDASAPPDVASTLIVLTGLAVVLVRWESLAGPPSGRADRGRLGELAGSPSVVGAVGFAALSGVGLLAFHAPTASPEGLRGAVVRASLAGLPPAAREDAIVTLADGLREAGAAFGLASAGAARAAGHLDGATTECGRCFEGGIPMPLKSVRAEVHAVAPDTFVHLGLAVSRGRDFDVGDRGTPSVALVSRALADRHFERGEPLGRRLRIGESEWLTVVGVVGDRDDVRTRTDYAIYVPLAQARPTELEILVDVSAPAAADFAVAAPPGVELGTPRSRADVFAVHLWFRAMLGVLGLAALVLLGAGLWVSAANEAAATRYEVAVRRAVGATRGAVWRFYVAFAGRRVLAALLVGAWLSLFLGAWLAEAHGSIPQMDLGVWGGAGVWVTAMYLLGSAPALLAAAERPVLPALEA